MITCVTRIRAGVVDEQWLFSDVKKAEAKYLEIVQQNQKLIQDDQDAVLDDGYFEFPDDGSICINHPLEVE